MGLFDRFRRSSGAAAVAELIRRDRWSLAEGHAGAGIAMIRFRTPVLSGRDARGHGTVLKVVWAYAPEGSGELPERAQREAMQLFEDRFLAAVERDALAVLAAVLTFDGTRQWVFYTRDAKACGARLTAMPQEAQRYPLELTSEADPDWRYLHEEILRGVPWRE